MRDVSAAWLRTVQGSWRPAFRATLCTYFQTGSSPTGTVLPIIDGQITLDGSASIRSTLDTLTISGAYWPHNKVNTDLAPQGSEVYVQIGIPYSDASVEWCGMGYFRIKGISQQNPELQGPIVVTGQDRMSNIVRAKPIAPIVLGSTMTVGDAAEALVLDVFPLATITWDDATNALTLGRTISVETDRYGALSALAQAYGKIVYWDSLGQLSFRSVPDIAQAVASIVDGRDGTLMSSPREITDEGVANAVVVRGNGADDAGSAYGVAIDADLDSPTGYYTEFGPAPVFIESAFVTTNAQAQSAAAAELVKRAGVPYSMALTCALRPELEPFDAVSVQNQGVSGAELRVLTSLQMPLVAGKPMSCGTRQRSLTSIGVFL